MRHQRKLDRNRPRTVSVSSAVRSSAVLTGLLSALFGAQALAVEYDYLELFDQRSTHAQLNNSGQVAWGTALSDTLYVYDGEQRLRVPVNGSFGGFGFGGGQSVAADVSFNDTGELVYLVGGAFTSPQIFSYRDGDQTNVHTADLTIFNLEYSDLHVSDEGAVSFRTFDLNNGFTGFHRVDAGASVLLHEIEGEPTDLYAVNGNSEFALADLSSNSLVFHNGAYPTEITAPGGTVFDERVDSLAINDSGEIVWSTGGAVYHFDGTRVEGLYKTDAAAIGNLTINNRGQIAWTERSEEDEDSLHTYRNGEATRLGTLTDIALSKLILNDNGEMAWQQQQLASDGNDTEIVSYVGGSRSLVTAGQSLELAGFNELGQVLVRSEDSLTLATPGEELPSENIQFVSVNDWYQPATGGGFIVNYRVVLGEDDVSGLGRDRWAFEPNYEGVGIAVNGWVTGYNGPVDAGLIAADGGYAVTSSASGFRSDLEVGQVLTFSVMVNGAGFNVEDFTPLFTNFTAADNNNQVESATAEFSVNSLNSWYNAGSGGFNVTLDVELTEQMLVNPEDFGWTIQLDYSGEGQIRQGWVVGYPGGVSVDRQSDSVIVYSTETQSFMPPIRVGDTITIAVTVDNAPFVAEEFSLSFSQ